MELNSLKPAAGAKRSAKRVGRGIGSGNGKTCGRGQKGQKSRSGSSTRPWFEGGQLPLQMRIPKFGFRSRVGMTTAEVRLGDIEKALDRVGREGGVAGREGGVAGREGGVAGREGGVAGREGGVAGAEGDVVDLGVLKAANVLSRNVRRARIMLSGSIARPVTVKGLGVTRGARAAIEAAGGRIEVAEERAS